MPRNVATSRPVPRNSNSSLFFNGANGSVAIGTTSDFNFERTESFSVVMNAYLAPNAPQRSLIGRRQNGSNFRGWELLTTASRQLRLILQNASGNRIVVDTSIFRFTPGMWYRVGFSYNGSSLGSGVGLYINGESMVTAIVENNLSATMAVTGLQACIGSRVGATAFWGGYIGGTIGLVNRALTAGEFTADYYNNVPPASPYYAAYTFSEGSGVSLADSSGNARNGVISNAPWSSTEKMFSARSNAGARSVASSRNPVT